MTKTVRIKSHRRRNKKGKLYKVAGYKRKKRRLGRKIRYKDRGRFQVAFDELGNFRGSRIIKTKRATTPKQTKKATRRRAPYRNTKQLDTDYFKGAITHNTWLRKRRELLELS